RGYALASLRSDWKMPGAAFRRGSLVAVKIEDITGAEEPQAAAVKTVFEPSPRASLQGVADTRDALLLDTLDNIRSRTLLVRESSGAWISSEIPQLGGGVSGISSANSFSDVYTATYNDFLTPYRLYLGDASKADASLSLIKELPARFDASGYVLEQGSATSRDGTVIPYFLVRPKNLRFDGQTPVLLNAYGGFEHSMLPSYAPTTGKLWLEQGGVYALANIRGGGEFGPEWHSAALKQNRQKAFDDFLAVAQNLVDRKITSPSKLGIIGGSNGGLLMGAAFTQRPDLFAAVVCQVPLLDMLRYHKLLAGASWMGEYGDPDSPEMRPYIEAYSPYQNIKPGVKYPPVFFVTSSKDDRVHPGHARKAAAKLLSYGDPVYYFENIDGGHGASANNTELARRLALQYAFLRLQLSGTASRP
ncbi:MAG: S9 family peptidase, partial [Elusimicrobia bacterium]|nr:S9 family peptidase [Elusimicrobiota bacterium]